jgi:hypothetical protein
MGKAEISKNKIVGKRIKKCSKKKRICNICYDEKNNKFVKCIKCNNNFCQKCWINNYKLSSRINGDCLNRDCNYLLNKKFIINNFSRSFLNYWNNSEINKVIFYEKNLVEQERRERDNNNEKNNSIQFKCPDEKCNGLFYIDDYNCTKCKKLICHKCHKFSNNNHTCKSSDVNDINEVLKNITQCPCCKEIIHKIAGCNDMFCTKCKTYFNFKTRKETGYRHNPHNGNLYNSNEYEINILQKQINQNINNEIQKKLNNFDFVKNQLKIYINKGQDINNLNNNQNITSSSSYEQQNITSSSSYEQQNITSSSRYEQQNITSSSRYGQNINQNLLNQSMIFNNNSINNFDFLSVLRNQQRNLLEYSTNNNQNTSSNSSNNQNTPSSNNRNNQTPMSLISGIRNQQRNLLEYSTNNNQNTTSSNSSNNQNTPSSNNRNNQTPMSLISVLRNQQRNLLEYSTNNNQNTTSSNSSNNQNTPSSNNRNNRTPMRLISALRNNLVNSTNNNNQNTTSSNSSNNQNPTSLFNDQQNNTLLIENFVNFLRSNDEDENNILSFNNYQSIYIFEKRCIYFKSNNIILEIDIESNIFKKVYELKDLETLSLLYVNNDKIILKNKDNLYFINKNNDNKLIVKSNSFLLMGDNFSPIGIKILIDLNKETGKIIYLSIENSIVEYNFNDSKIHNKWDLPTEHVYNCEDIRFIENRKLFIFNMKNNLQFFKIQPDSKLVFLTVIVSNNIKIINSNFVNTKYIIGIGINEKHKYFEKIENNIIDLDKLEVVKTIEYPSIANLNDFNEIYFENENIYYFYSKNFLKKIKFYKVDIKKSIESTNNCIESIDFLESFRINNVNLKNVYKFIPELKILMTISNPKKNIFTLPYIYKLNKINDSINNIQLLQNNFKKLLTIMNTYQLNTNNIHVFNLNIRNRYLNNRINEKCFENKIKKNFNEFQKKKDINNIFNLMKVSFKSILDKYQNRYLENNEDFKKEFQQIEKMINKDFETHKRIFSGSKLVLNLFSENINNVLERG